MDMGNLAEEVYVVNKKENSILVGEIIVKGTQKPNIDFIEVAGRQNFCLILDENGYLRLKPSDGLLKFVTVAEVDYPSITVSKNVYEAIDIIKQDLFSKLDIMLDDTTFLLENLHLTRSIEWMIMYLKDTTKQRIVDFSFIKDTFNITNIEEQKFVISCLDNRIEILDENEKVFLKKKYEELPIRVIYSIFKKVEDA